MQCYWCEEVFEDASTCEEFEGNFEAWGVRAPYSRTLECCPRCGSTDLEEVDECCDECQEIVVKVEDHLPEWRVA